MLRSFALGYLKCYNGREFQQAVAEFTEKYPDIALHIINGNHEELYDELRLGRVDLVLNDQRRAFSDEYVNSILTTCECYIEIAGRSPIAGMESVDVRELKDIPCILVASKNQQENEQSYYHDIVGIGGKGFMPVEGSGQTMQFGTSLNHVPLLRNGKPIKRNYCAFWKADNSGYYVEEFADILKAKFETSD